MDRVLTVHFIDGTKLAFDFPEQSTSVTAKRLKLSDLAGKHLLVEAEGQVMLFPTTGIKYVSLSMPMLGKKDAAALLPSHAIVGARIRS